LPHLHAELELARPIDEVFAFFADARNLERITPPELAFRILTPGPIEIRAGTLIDYQLSLFGVKFQWTTEIRDWEPPHRFVDVQLRGPYRRWIHTHRFESVPGGTRIVDDVDYALPLWPAGEVARPIVAFQLGRIFRYRSDATRRLIETVPSAPVVRA
jgi:ligand-binding SRPBCC domain-containing protein